ncbi:MAG: ATP-dependent Clp protease ATP-binding subunit [Clostridiaceae bacterium]|nr:ATP-dependent Clp protease ATP-binding subunit [Clostridiaceae bacterium]
MEVDLMRFTDSASNAINTAIKKAISLGLPYVGTEHILYGIVSEKQSISGKLFAKHDVTPEKIEPFLNRLAGDNVGQKVTIEQARYTPRTKRVIDNSFREASARGQNFVGTEHLLVSLISEPDSIAVRILMEIGVEPQKFLMDLNMILTGQEMMSGENVGGMPNMNTVGNDTRRQEDLTILKFGKDLTEMARGKKFDPVIGREKEVQRIMQILSRRTKNNPCLIGEPGVGKTAIVEGLAQLIASGDVPEIMRDKRVITLDLSSMVAGTRYRGDFEERIKKAIDEVIKSKNIILFIDELHTIIGAGSAEGALDAANILKPALSRGELQIIGATTLNEYRKHIEKDAALERRFQPIMVDEPSPEDTIRIVFGLRDKYESHHNVTITDEALKAAVYLSHRYISDRFLPDKAIDLIDEAASKKRLLSYTLTPDLKNLEEALAKLQAEKEEAINHQDFERAAKIRDEERRIKGELEEKKNEWDKKKAMLSGTVTEDDIAEIVADWTGIPVTRLNEDEAARLLNLERQLHERVIGQEEAVKAVAKAIRRGRMGLKDPKRPTGSFIFLGPTGVGKTELSRALAELLFGDEQSMIRIDMSEYMEKHSVSRLIGSPPGYVGYDEGGQLTEKVRRKPYSVVLFDEIEKAHPDVFNILLQIMEDGRLTDSHGRVVDFKNTVIIMTSNVGARNITEPKRLGFADPDISEHENYENMKKNVMEELKRTFRPEFLNRVDDIIVFEPLSKEQIVKIAQLLLNDLKKRASLNDIELTFEDGVAEFIADKGFDPVFGARPLKRAIQTHLEDKLSEGMLRGDIDKGRITIYIEDGTPKYRKTE